MRTTALFAALVASLLPATHAFAAECHQPGDESAYRWDTGLDYMLVYPSQPDGAIDTWTFNQQSYLYRQLLFDTADAACAQWVKLVPGFNPTQRATKKLKVVDAKSQWCALDANGNGSISDAEQTNTANATLLTTWASTDSICDVAGNPNKMPYTGLYQPSGGHFVRGSDFTGPQKDLIKAKNQLPIIQTDPLKKVYWSDARGLTFLNDMNQVENVEPHPNLSLSTINPDYTKPQSPEVDHMIPRVDKYGCGCGTNSPENALLVSRRINGLMSNYPNTPRRVALLAKFTAVPHTVPLPSDEIDDTAAAPDEASTDEIGGCSATGGAGAASSFGVGALALVVGRRRRRR